MVFVATEYKNSGSFLFKIISTASILKNTVTHPPPSPSKCPYRETSPNSLEKNNRRRGHHGMGRFPHPKEWSRIQFHLERRGRDLMLWCISGLPVVPEAGWQTSHHSWLYPVFVGHFYVSFCLRRNVYSFTIIVPLNSFVHTYSVIGLASPLLDSCYRLKPLIDSRHMEGFSLEVCCCSKLCGYQFQLLANNCFGENIKVSSGHWHESPFVQTKSSQNSF